MDSDTQSQEAGPGKPRPDTKLLKLESMAKPPKEHRHTALEKYQHPPRASHPLRALRVVIFLTAFALVGTVVLVLYKRDVRIQARKAAIILEARRQAGRDQRTDIATSVEHVLIMSRGIADYAAVANEASAFVMSGPSFTPPSPPPAPAESEPEPESDDEDVPDDLAPPEGIMSRAQLERRRTTPQPTQPVVTVPVTRVKPERPEIALIAESTREEAEAAAKAAVTAREIDAKANRLEQHILLAHQSSLTDKPSKELQDLLTSARDLDKQLSAVLPVVRQKTERAVQIRTHAAAERKRLEEEQARVEAEQRSLRRIAEETSRARTAETECAELLKQHGFERILRTLEDQKGACETEEGRTAFGLLLDRYTRVHNFELFVIEQVKSEPFRWGWIQDGQPLDVLGADEHTVKIPGRSIPWGEVSTRQMLHFLKYYTANDKIAQRVRAEQSLAGAIYCHAQGGMKAAATYAEKAIELNPRLADEVERLLPELPQ